VPITILLLINRETITKMKDLLLLMQSLLKDSTYETGRSSKTRTRKTGSSTTTRERTTMTCRAATSSWTLLPRKRRMVQLLPLALISAKEIMNS
jgi:hypothetical protein